MQDLFYLGCTVLFFGLMMAFVKGCERIVGHDDDVEPVGDPASANAAESAVTR